MCRGEGDFQQPVIALRRRQTCAVVLLVALSGCDNPPEDSAARDVQRRLVGTWLREYEEQGTRVRRVLVLLPDGRFHEASHITPPDGLAAQDAQGSGEWVFDGTNLKRRYLVLNGKPAGHPRMPYATFALRFPSRTEFVGVDHVRRREVRYARVPDGTLP